MSPPRTPAEDAAELAASLAHLRLTAEDIRRWRADERRPPGRPKGSRDRQPRRRRKPAGKAGNPPAQGGAGGGQGC